LPRNNRSLVPITLCDAVAAVLRPRTPAIAFLVVGEDIAGRLPKGRSYMADQLRRAALSIVLNTAEGAGEFSPADKARFYRMARRSATECAAIVDAARALGMAEDEKVAAARALLSKSVAMLTLLVAKVEGRVKEG
jgi:four helix bundle protein